MPSSNMADIDDDDEWSSFDSTPTESFSRISFKSDSYETLGPPQTCDAGLEGDRGTPAEEIARCFPLLPAAPAKDDTYFAFSFNDSRISTSQMLKTLSSFQPALRWKGSRTEAAFIRALRLRPAQQNSFHKPQRWAANASLPGDAQLFNYHSLCKRTRPPSAATDPSGHEHKPKKNMHQSGNRERTTGSNLTNVEAATVDLSEFSRLNFDGHQAAVGLSHHSMDELLLLKEEMAAYVQEYSDVLVEELTHRDEQLREKTVKNKFISTLLAVQSRISLQQNKGKKSYTSTEKYLTTVIPYREEMGGLSTAVLKSLTDLMEAMLSDSPTVPSLLTDYILKVLCPEDG